MKNNIGQSIKLAREKACLTQKEVEKKLELRSLSMRDYEVERLKLPVSVAIDLAKIYEISLDELVGFDKKVSENNILKKELEAFDSLFLSFDYNDMFNDPVLIAFLELHLDRSFKHSIFEVLTSETTEQEKKELILEVSKLLFSLAAADGKICKEEIDCIRGLLSSFKLKNKYKEISAIELNYFPETLPKALKNIEMRHFVIWTLFLFSKADNEISFEEVEYIEKCAELLKVNKSNYLFIKEKFVKDSY